MPRLRMCSFQHFSILVDFNITFAANEYQRCVRKKIAVPLLDLIVDPVRVALAAPLVAGAGRSPACASEKR